jgi:ribose/xylose/arabinose/galactoside ABC-type transport system permease subunit
VRRYLAIARRRPSLFAGALAICLFLANIAVIPEFVGRGQIAPTFGTLAPFAIAGMASTPAFISGGGGIDLSIAPLMGLVNIVLVTKLLGTSFGGPEVAVPLLLALGTAVGGINGVLVALAAVALGGTNLAGGRGGLLASALGATCIFLLDNLLSALNVSATYIQVAYGGALLTAVVLGSLAFSRPAAAA